VHLPQFSPSTVRQELLGPEGAADINTDGMVERTSDGATEGTTEGALMDSVKEYGRGFR
jgi:hypothetical protein